MILEKVKGRKLPIELRGCLVRPDSPDTEMLKDCGNVYGDIDFDDQVCLDLGANIGGFTVLAIRRGARMVHAFEPVPDNYEIMTKNIQRCQGTDHTEIVATHDSAIWTCDGELEFVVPSSKNGPCSAHIGSVRRAAKGEKIRVRCESLQRILDETRPGVVKMDIEGAEFDVLEDVHFPESVHTLAIEWHLSAKENRERYKPFERMFETWDLMYRRGNKVFGVEDAYVECVYQAREGSLRKVEIEGRLNL